VCVIDNQGRPFMESLMENKALLYSLLISGGAIVALATGFIPDASAQFQLVEIDPEVNQLD
jgi:manganese-transporting P-type ATPase